MPSDTPRLGRIEIPRDVKELVFTFPGDRRVKLTNLDKVFWPDDGYTKRDLLEYYASIAPVLVPHIRDRAMVMKRYPNGIDGGFFFMKRAPDHRPDWIETCLITHSTGTEIDYPVVQDAASLLWTINLGCIDLNQWYARIDDIHRPDYLHFDLDPVKGKPETPFSAVRDAALFLKVALDDLGLPSFPKTTGSRGIHVYIPIERGPTQDEVRHLAKLIAQALASMRPDLLTVQYRTDLRPAGRVLVDYNQNAWGQTLASIYSVRPVPRACVSAPVTWDEIEAGIEIQDFRIDNMIERVNDVGDLHRALVEPEGRVRLETILEQLGG